MGAIYYRNGEYIEAKPFFLEAITIHKSSNHPKKQVFLADAYNNLAIISLQLGDAKSAVDGFTNYIALMESSNDLTKIGIGHYNLGIVYGAIGDRTSKIEMYKKLIIFSLLSHKLYMN